MRTFWAAVASCAVLLHTASALYSAKDSVVELTATNFKDQVLKDDGVWYVEFYAPWCGHCKNLATDWKNFARAGKGVVKVGAVDASVHTKLASKYGVQGFPTIKVFGKNKRSPADYNSGRDVQSFMTHAMESIAQRVKDNGVDGAQIKDAPSAGGSGSKARRGKARAPRASEPGGGKSVVRLGDSDFDDVVFNSPDVGFMVELYAPWCGHCKQLAPEWAAAAEATADDGVKFVAVDATEAQATGNKFGVRGYPTIKWVPPGARSASDAQDYNGERSASAMAAFARAQIEASGRGRAPIEQLTSPAQFKKACMTKGTRLCFVAIVRDLRDEGAAKRASTVSMLEEVAKANRGSHVRFFWAAPGDHPGMESAVDLQGNVPTVLSFNLRKKAASVHAGRFDKEAVNRFVNMMGRSSSARMVRLADSKIAIADVPEWDGKDAPAVVEEEFSLDDIMNMEL